jgi:RecA-family ATPase
MTTHFEWELKDGGEIYDISNKNEMHEKTDEEQKLIKRREYMRAYKKRKYDEDKEKALKYRTEMNLKKKYNINNEIWTKYKNHLQDVLALMKIKNNIPREMLLELIMNPPQELIEKSFEDN